MSPGPQPVDDLDRGLGLDPDPTVALDLPAGGVQRRLWVEAVVEHPGDDLKVSLGLHLPTHHAEGSDRDAVAGEEGGDDRVAGPLAGGGLVGVALIEHEAGSPVLQRDPVGGHDHAATEAHVVGLDEADHHAAGIGRAEVDGAAPDRLTMWRRPGPVTDQHRPLGQVGRIDQPVDRDVDDRLVADEGIDIGEGQLHGLDLEVPGRGIDLGMGRQVGSGQGAERHEGGDALPVGRDLPHLVTPVGDPDRIDPLSVVGGEVVGGESTTGLGCVAGDGGRHLALVEIA